ncbi:3-phosphoshikimate 1-carboxyvinyltransferase [bacterium]
MKRIKVSKKYDIQGEIKVPSDKSITHRAFILASIGQGKSIIKNPLLAEDCMNTLKALNSLGVEFEIMGKDIIIKGRGQGKFISPENVLDLGNSGTGIRLMTGLLAGQENLNVVMTGDSSLQNRPMKRIMTPLREMGACIKAREDKYPPLLIKGQKLKGIKYVLPMASAQVKSCILLAGLFAKGNTEIVEPMQSRNHTENMFAHLGIDLSINNNVILLKPALKNIKASSFFVPGDISSAAFFIVLGLILSKKGILLKDVGINITRRGIIDVLIKMGGHIVIENKRTICGEEVADIFVKKSDLKAVDIGDREIPLLIDEIPILALAAVFAEGKTEITGAEELRYKESDRIASIVMEFSKLGANITEKKDGFIIQGTHALKGTKVFSHKDHRMAMTLIIAGLLAEGEIEVEDIECIDTSFPNFLELLKEIVV